MMIVLIALLFLILMSSSFSSDKCVKFGTTFDVSLEGNNVLLDCSYTSTNSGSNIPVCCAALNMTSQVSSSKTKSRGIGYGYQNNRNIGGGQPVYCEMLKKYIPSPLEMRDYEKAVEIDNMDMNNREAKFNALLEYTLSDEMIMNSTKWLNRVSVHMSSFDNPSINDDDMEFLSRFHITRKCGAETTEWDEWIEPLTITARHPFGFGRCKNTQHYFKKNIPKVGRSNVDYVLLQSGRSIYNSSYTTSGRRVKSKQQGERMGLGNKHIFLDAGTSMFDSSLRWFLCGYSQRNVSFDMVKAWEMTILDPQEYWSRVPSQWKPYWTFMNVPISANHHHPDSPVRIIKSIANVNDFVSFKLDIDHPDTELPIALSLLSDPSFARLVDEFFFELHFQCEVMTLWDTNKGGCGWGTRVPQSSHGLRLDRSSILRFFAQLREKGIRAHIWP